MEYTQKEIFNSLAKFLLDINSTKDFNILELYISLSNNVLGLSGNAYSISGEAHSLRTKPNEEIKLKIRFLKEITKDENFKEWNRAKFSVTKDGKFKIEFVEDNKLKNGIDDFDWKLHK